MCGCEVAEGDEYCSDFCRQPTEGGMDMGTGDDCGCGHDACKKMAM
jgi:hypothetical protein